MADHKEPKKTDDPEAVARRAFLKKVGTVGATAPAAALLLAASNKRASAQIYGGCDTCGSLGSGSGGQIGFPI